MSLRITVTRQRSENSRLRWEFFPWPDLSGVMLHLVLENFALETAGPRAPQGRFGRGWFRRPENWYSRTDPNHRASKLPLHKVPMPLDVREEAVRQFEAKLSISVQHSENGGSLMAFDEGTRSTLAEQAQRKRGG